jgi:hypothetical protein
MNLKERVLQALDHKEPAKVAVIDSAAMVLLSVKGPG